MRQFKNIKTGEEAKPIKGFLDFYSVGGGEVVPARFIEDSSDWKEIVEKDYEILEDSIGDDKIEIISVKRLPDGEIFSIGDWFKCGGCGGRIDKFNIIWGEVLIGDCKFPLNDIKKVKQPLFKTEDDISIYEGDSYYVVTKDFKLGYCSSYSKPDLCFKLFAKKENAEKHIELNAKKYSIKDIVLAVNNWAMSPCIDENGILNFLAKNENTKN